MGSPFRVVTRQVFRPRAGEHQPGEPARNEPFRRKQNGIGTSRSLSAKKTDNDLWIMTGLDQRFVQRQPRLTAGTHPAALTFSASFAS
jgi:hypothetical protein